MNKLAYLILVIAAVFGAVQATTADEHFVKLYYNLANASVFFALVLYLIESKVNPALRARKAHIEQQLETSSQHLRVAESKKRDIEERLDTVDRERIESIRAHQAEGERMSKVILQNAERAARRIKEDVVRQIANETTQANKELHQQAIIMAINKARMQLEAGFNAEEDRKLRRAVIESAFGA